MGVLNADSQTVQFGRVAQRCNFQLPILTYTVSFVLMAKG